MDGNEAPHQLSPGDASALRRTRKVFISDLEIIASVGVYAHEKRYKQRLLINMELRIRDAYDGTTDRILDVYDYDNAIRAAESAVAGTHINLIETVAERIAERCLEHASVLGIRLRIEKPDVQSPARSVGIEIERGAVENRQN